MSMKTFFFFFKTLILTFIFEEVHANNLIRTIILLTDIVLLCYNKTSMKYQIPNTNMNTLLNEILIK